MTTLFVLVLLFISSTIRQPAVSTLFPYTTLFRSGITEHAQDLLGDMVFVELPEVGAQVAAGDDVAVCESVKAASEDRKSTRLNSSHVRISYAVFCLKKKKMML